MKSAWLAWATVFVLVPGLAGTSAAQAQGKKNPGKKPAVPVVEAESALKPGQLAGKLGQVSGSALTLRVEFDRLELKSNTGRGTNGRNNTNLIRMQQRMAQAQQRLQTARTPQQRMSAMRQLEQLQRQMLQGGSRGGQSPYKVVKDYKDFEIDLAASAEVRTMFLPTVYDEKGNFKKYSQAELKELKGPNPQAPGYKSDITILKPGQTVVINLSKNKGTENKLQATRIVVTQESTDPAPVQKGGKKNKKK
jgi:hypothetical protein